MNTYTIIINNIINELKNTLEFAGLSPAIEQAFGEFLESFLHLEEVQELFTTQVSAQFVYRMKALALGHAFETGLIDKQLAEHCHQADLFETQYTRVQEVLKKYSCIANLKTVSNSENTELLRVCGMSYEMLFLYVYHTNRSLATLLYEHPRVIFVFT